MKNTFLLLAVLLLSSTSFADDTDTHASAFKRAVERLKNERTMTAVSYGANGVKVACTALPQKKIVAIAWEIDNPNRSIIDIAPEDIRLYDQVREVDSMTPAEANTAMYGPAPDATAETIPSRLVNADTPAEVLQPPLQRESQAQKDIFGSAFSFVKTDARLITGLTYYEWYGDNERLVAEITLNGEILKFKFRKTN